jgi:NTP pyrophosphatase (non-canonical NTP hydrolase)
VNNKEYQRLAEITESKDFDLISERMKTVRAIRLLHAVLGLASEVGEIADQIKRHFFYGKPLDVVNLAEEIGDLFWYQALTANELAETHPEIDFDSIEETNIAKLKKRYGDKFSEQRATKRNLQIERQILEGRMRPARPGDPSSDIICDQCGKPCGSVPFYCMECGIDYGKGGGVVGLRDDSK